MTSGALSTFGHIFYHSEETSALECIFCFINSNKLLTKF